LLKRKGKKKKGEGKEEINSKKRRANSFRFRLYNNPEFEGDEEKGIGVVRNQKEKKRGKGERKGDPR